MLIFITLLLFLKGTDITLQIFFNNNYYFVFIFFQGFVWVNRISSEIVSNCCCWEKGRSSEENVICVKLFHSL